MTVLGIDVSKWDGNWDAAKAKKAGATFVFIKSSQATSTDPQFVANWQKAKEAGLLRGAYHYLDYTKPGLDQANYFADLLKDDPGELPPVIDYELRRTDNNPSAALGFLRQCLDQLIQRTELYKGTGPKKPMVYTGPAFWVEYGDQTKRDYWIQFPLWNAHWITSSAPIVPQPWNIWKFWQFTDKGPGEAFGSECLAIDMNRFNGTLNELLEFAGLKAPTDNLNELVDTLNKKVTDLEEVVSAINQAGDSSQAGLSSRIDTLEGQFSTLGGSITNLTSTLTQRISTMEQKIAALGTIGSESPASSPLPVSSDPSATQVSPVPIDMPPAEPAYALCSTNVLNVRSGPGASFPIVAALRYGDRVKVIQHQDGWAQLEAPAGWSSETYLSFDQSTPPLPVEPPQLVNPPASYGICNTSGLNVRSGPGATYPIVGGLTYGQRIKILSHQNSWAQIESPAGWSNETYLSFA